jgi:hypothetical protein
MHHPSSEHRHAPVTEGAELYPGVRLGLRVTLGYWLIAALCNKPIRKA